MQTNIDVRIDILRGCFMKTSSPKAIDQLAFVAHKMRCGWNIEKQWLKTIWQMPYRFF